MIFLKFDRRIFQHFDWTLLALVLSVCVIGILNIYSTGFSASEGQFPLYLKQIQWIALGLIFMMIIFFIDYRVIIQGAYVIYGISIALLVFVYLFGYAAHGSQRWLGGGGFALQPSELMKLVIIITLARYFDDHKSNEPYKLKELFVPFLIVFVPFLMILKQPDLGTALMWMAFVRQTDPDAAAEVDSLYRGALAAEEPDSAAQALTLDLYAQYLNAHDRAAEGALLQARAKAIHKTRSEAIGQRRVAISPGMRVSGEVKAPSLISTVEPEYSEEARAMKYSGTVLLKVVVDVDGKAKDIELMKSLGLGLDEQAVLAIQQWRFKPGEQGGVPVAVMAQIEVNFKLL